MEPEPDSRYSRRSTEREIPDGLEVAPTVEGDKQVVQAEKEVAHLEEDFPIPMERAYGDGDYAMSKENEEMFHGPKNNSSPRHRTVCGMRLKLLVILLGVATLFVLGLAIGLGVGLSLKGSGEVSSEPINNASSSPPMQEALSIGGGLNESYYSSKGAWNGSGLAYTWQTFSSDLEGQPKDEARAVMYYQHHSGALRWMRRLDSARWLRGPEQVEDVAVDAKNATPISAMYLIQNQTSLWHVFYINKEHKIAQRSGSNVSATWTDGPINGANLTAYDGDLAGLNVCWAGIDGTLTMRLWYASSNTTFEEYLYNNEEREWDWQKQWAGFSGAAGVGCVTDPDHPYIYAAFVNLQNSVEIHYRTREDAYLSTAGWEKSEAVIPDVYLASSITLSGNKTVVQTTSSDDETSVSIVNMRWDGRDTEATSSEAIVLRGRSRGSHLASMYIGGEIAVYSQIDGDDITEWLEDGVTGSATLNNIMRS